MADKYIHLHVHSHGSFLDSTVLPDALAKRVKELGMSAVALTDHANLFNAITFYTACEAQGVKPILGCEINYVASCEEAKKTKSRRVQHLVLLAENNVGWQNLVKLVSLSNNEENFYYVPRIDIGMLEKHKEGLIALSACAGGVVASHLKERKDSDGVVIDYKNPFQAEAAVRLFKNIFGSNNFFLEVQDTDNAEHLIINGELRKLALKHGLRTIVTSNVHYLGINDSEGQKTLLKIGGDHWGSSLTELENSTQYLKAENELTSDILPEEIALTSEIASRCNVIIDLKKQRLPTYPYTPEGKTAMSYLTSLVHKGFQDRKLPDSSEYRDRVARELCDIEKLGFADYFLIVWDVLAWVRSQNILLGCGRGSVGGSLSAYCLGITDIDPLKYDLIWERFLNVGRASLPDIDTDVPRSKRGLVIDYIRQRFGADNVAQLATFNKLAARAALKDVFKVFGMEFSEANKITQLLPMKDEDHTAITLDKAIEMVSELKTYEERYKSWFNIARAVEGRYKSLGTHAAAVVIADKPFAEGHYPLCRSADSKNLVFSWEMGVVDKLSLMKLDVLGLSTLDVIQDTFDLIESRHGKRLTLQDIPLDNQKTFDLLSDGKNTGVFQLESQLGKTWAKQLKPRTIEEICSLISLIRPGPLECITGDTIILVHKGDCSSSRPSKFFKYKTVQELYSEYRRIQAKKFGKKYGCPPLMKIMSLNEATHTLVKNQILKIEKTGKKEIFSVKLIIEVKNNRKQTKWMEIRASENHKFLTLNGWKELKSLNRNDYVCLLRKCFGRRKNNKYAEGWKNFRDIALQHYQYHCVFCDWEEASIDVNHISGGRLQNNHPDNLSFMCPNHHRMYTEGVISKEEIIKCREEYKLPNTDDVLYFRVEEVVSVGHEETFDIAMDGPWHNFIAGGFVVHNSGMAKVYRDVGNGECIPQYPHESLKPILDKHRGSLIFQESVMEICKQVAGMSLMDCGLLLKTIGKKKPEELRKWQTAFVNGCKANKISEDKADEIWSWINTFSGYGFVKAHGISYALLAYYTAYLKTNYTVEFFCAALKNAKHAQDSSEEMKKFIYDAKIFGIQVIPPKYTKGNIDFDIISDTEIAFGLSSLKGVGEKAIEVLKKQGRIFNNFDELLTISLNKRVGEALILSGALDEFGESRTHMRAKYQLYGELTEKESMFLADKPKWIESLRHLSDEIECLKIKASGHKIPNSGRRETIRELLRQFDASNPFDGTVEKIGWEQHYLGISLTGRLSDLVKARNVCSDVVNYGGQEMPVELAVQISSIKPWVTKKGQTMAFMTAGDETYELDNFVIFPALYERFKSILEAGSILKIRGKVDDRGSVIVDRLERVR